MPSSMPPTGDNKDSGIADVLLEAAGEIGLPLGNRELLLFSDYQRELIKWNRIVSLVSVKSLLEIPVTHFIDSLTALPLLPREGGRLLDIGTGAGFPGLPLKIIRPDIDLHLLEASRKKVSFLKELVRKLGLPGVTIIHDRVERVMEQSLLRESFACVISRAAFKIPELWNMGSYFLHPGGLLVAMRGPRDEAASHNIGQLADNKGFCLEKIEGFHLPVSGVSRKILLYKKIQ